MLYFTCSNVRGSKESFCFNSQTQSSSPSLISCLCLPFLVPPNTMNSSAAIFSPFFYLLLAIVASTAIASNNILDKSTSCDTNFTQPQRDLIEVGGQHFHPIKHTLQGLVSNLIAKGSSHLTYFAVAICSAVFYLEPQAPNHAVQSVHPSTNSRCCQCWWWRYATTTIYIFFNCTWNIVPQSSSCLWFPMGHNNIHIKEWTKSLGLTTFTSILWSLSNGFNLIRETMCHPIFRK